MSDLLREIDKNDVDISQLFKWSKKVELSDTTSGTTVNFYMRLLGDSDLNRARAHGYRKAADLRKKLKTQDSDERVTLLAELEDFSDKEMLIKSVEILRISEIYQRALKAAEVNEPKEPTGDDQEKWEKYQIAVDEYPKKFRASVDKIADKLRADELKSLEERSTEELYKIYEGEIINKLCQEAMNNGFYDMCIYLSTFKDKDFKYLSFNSFEDYDNIHPHLKEKLREEYQRLEMGIELLKKLPEATE